MGPLDPTGAHSMTTTSHPQSIPWRALSAAELAANPEARLGGALGVIFWGAVAMVAAVVLLIAWLIAIGDFFSVAMASRMMFSASSTASVISGIWMIPQAMFFSWACAFAVMTMGRRPSTPKVASVLMVTWALTSIGAQIVTRYVISQESFVLDSQASLLPYIILDIVLVTAFCGYMHEGRRPNIYFLKRVRA
jgi:hypothetical protein